MDFHFIYRMTKTIYSHAGKPSIDPVVFPDSQAGWFKCLLVGYLENLCDRAGSNLLSIVIKCFINLT